MKIYLDNNAGTPLDPRVIDSMMEHLKHNFGNPSSLHYFGRQALQALNQSRTMIAKFLKCKPEEIIFTSSGTEAINLVLRGIAELYPNDHYITSNAEHACVHHTLQELEKAGAQVSYLPVGLWGTVTPQQVKDAIRPNTKLIALISVNNEIGVKLDIPGISQVAFDAGIPLLLDGVALLGKEPFIIPKGVSAMCFSGHKIHAPKGVGFAFIRQTFKFPPVITGGAQEWGRRAGTENLPGIVALGKAMSLLETELESASKRMLELRHRFEDGLKKHLGNVSVNGEGPRVSNTVNLSFNGVDGESLLIALDQAGIAASHGSACMSGARQPSRVLEAMGLPLDVIRSSLRFSLSRMTTVEEIDMAVDVISTIAKKLRK